MTSRFGLIFNTQHVTLLLLFVSFAVTAQTPTPTPDLKNPDVLLTTAEARDGLGGDDLQPWHIKADYDVFDAYGKPAGTGTFEEWWISKDKWKRSYTGNHYTGIEYHLPEGTAHEPESPKTVPWPESLIAAKLLSPLGRREPAKAYTNETGPHTANPPKFEIQPLPFSKTPLACVVPVPEVQKQYAPWATDFCFEPGTAELRMSQTDDLDSLYNKMATFQGRSISLEFEVACNQRPVVNVHVKTLAGFPGTGGALFHPNVSIQPNTKENPALKLPSGVMAGRKLSGGNPAYPHESKSRGEQGVVMISATIDTLGTLTNLQVLESPSVMLTESALDAVKKWRYQPYLLNGSPVEVETTVNVIFRLER